MGQEIERKFLVRGEAWRTAEGVAYCQGYLNRDPERTVRVRVAGPKAWLTVKGSNQGATRAEFEYEIPLVDGQALLHLCDGPRVLKVRHRVQVGATLWEVDEFFGDNAGLVVAEVELPAEDAPFERPDWLGAEVTGDPRYYNSNLAALPFTQWP